MKLIKERSEWFDYPKDPDGLKLEIAYLNSGQKQEIMQSVTDVKYIVKNDNEEAVVIPNAVKSRVAVIVARIKNWDNMYDDDGKKKLECTDENKIRFSCFDGVMDEVDKMAKKIDKRVEAELKKEVKNSKSSQSG